MPPALLSRRLEFPDASQADAEGLVAVGGDLSPKRLLLAYRSGIFPWTVQPITWWSPDPRGIFELESFRPARRLAQLIRQRPFEVTTDRAFTEVMRGCASPARGRETTWITGELVDAYTALHRLGHAHSVECWAGGELVGGIYGVHVGGLFAAESMFHRADNASKIALAQLVSHLRERGFALLDIQMLTAATRALGAVEISRKEYLQRLARVIAMECAF